ncbi:hypothetical protein [Cupriavidus nantongensis]
MSKIDVTRSVVDEERYFAVLDEKQLERLIAQAVATAAGVDLDQPGVYVKRAYVTSRDSSTGPRKEAHCEIVVDRRKHAGEEAS